ncbi:hypothetical protein C8R45DRAFT_930264 [Mycena sanguinolenta]|nr:hypothetical protein C8R45DRAFT_930264 [Mycena sanguinolenta]
MGLHRFHQAKGFDLDSQDVAQHLGYPLYKLSGPFAHIDEEYSDKPDDEDETGQNHRDKELDPALESTLTEHVAGSALVDPALDLAVSSYRLVFQEIVDSIPTDPDLVTVSAYQDVKEAFEDIVNSSRMDRDPSVASADQDVEQIPVSNTFRFILNVQLSLLFYLILGSGWIEMKWLFILKYTEISVCVSEHGFQNVGSDPCLLSSGTLSQEKIESNEPSLFQIDMCHTRPGEISATNLIQEENDVAQIPNAITVYAEQIPA